MSDASPPAPKSVADSPRARAWILAALAVVLGASFPYLSRMMNANERPRVLQALAWVDSGELAIDGPAARGIPAGVDVARSPVDGRLYPNKPPGTTVVAAVGYGLLRGVAWAQDRDLTLREVTWVMRLFAGLLPALALAWFLLRRFRAAAPAVVLVFVATPLVSYARLLFGHALAAALLTTGLVLVAEALVEPGRQRRAFFGGALAGAAVTVEYGAAFGGLPLAWLVLAAAMRSQHRPMALAAIAGAAVPLGALALYHDAVFGSPFSTPYHHVVDGGFAATHAQGLLGLGVPTATTLAEHLISPWGGLLYWAPVCALVLGIAVVRFGTLSPLARLVTVTFAVLLLFNLGLSQTGGWRVGPRYLVVGMPLCIVPLAELLPTVTRHRWLASTMVGLVVFATFVNFVAGNVLPFPIPVGNPLADQMLPLWTGGYAPYSILSPALGTVGALTAVGFVTLLVLSWALLSLPWPDPKSVLLGVAGGTGLAVALMVAALSIAPADDAESNLRAWRSIWEPMPGVAVAHTLLSPLAPEPTSQ